MDRMVEIAGGIILAVVVMAVIVIVVRWVMGLLFGVGSGDDT